MRKLLMAGALAAAGVLAVPKPSQAGVRLGIFIGHDFGYAHPDTYHIGFDRGYADGRQQGWADGYRSEVLDFWRDGRYRCGDVGYRFSYGPRGEYIGGYRQGYEQAYRAAFWRGRQAERWQDRREQDRDHRFGWER